MRARLPKTAVAMNSPIVTSDRFPSEFSIKALVGNKIESDSMLGGDDGLLVPVEGSLLGLSLLDDVGDSLGDWLGCSLVDVLGKDVGKSVGTLEEGMLVGEVLGGLVGETLGLWLGLPDEGIPLG